MMKWMLHGEEIDELPEDVYGFVYMIHYSSGHKYIGKKNRYKLATIKARKDGVQRPNSARIHKRVKLTDKELAERTPAQVRTNVKAKNAPFDIVKTEGTWRTYCGSTKNSVGLVIQRKEIIAIAYHKKELTYLETQQLFCNNVLYDDLYLNDNILGRFYGESEKEKDE